MIYNSNTFEEADDRNPNIAQSNVWYWVTGAGESGYLSEVYLEPAYRNLPLPTCDR